MDVSREALTRAANQLGFVLVGFARLRRIDEREAFYRQWLADDGHATMAYLAREPERRFDPRRLDPRLRSVVSLGYPYAARATPVVDWRGELRGRIAAYALGRDYHDVVGRRARAVAGVRRQPDMAISVGGHRVCPTKAKSPLRRTGRAASKNEYRA